MNGEEIDLIDGFLPVERHLNPLGERVLPTIVPPPPGTPVGTRAVAVIRSGCRIVGRGDGGGGGDPAVGLERDVAPNLRGADIRHRDGTVRRHSHRTEVTAETVTPCPGAEQVAAGRCRRRQRHPCSRQIVAGKEGAPSAVSREVRRNYCHGNSAAGIDGGNGQDLGRLGRKTPTHGSGQRRPRRVRNSRGDGCRVVAVGRQNGRGGKRGGHSDGIVGDGSGHATRNREG